MSKRPSQPLTLDYSVGFLKAARTGNLDQFLEYLKLNIDINVCNANGLTALHLAAKEGHDHVVSELVRRRANIESATRKGNTPLHIAALGGHEAVVRILLENGANVNAKSQDGFTPLYMAAQENHVEVVKYLLDHSADHTIITQDGYTPLAVALQLGHDEVVGVLMDQDTIMQTKTKLPALHRAAKKDDVQTALMLIQKDRIASPKTGGGIVNEITKSGFTPLHIASHYGNSRVGCLLIENGADINFKARNLVTPLHVASKWGRGTMVQVLLDNGADINCLTKDGLTALHCAARSGHDNVARLLMQRGAGVMGKTKSRLSPLHMSAQGDHLDCAELFIRNQAPIDDVTIDYLTPLHVTAHCGSVRTCKLLLDNRCEINARALNGFTPLHVACKKNRVKIIELLLRYGVAIEATTETGLTPLQVASFMGHMGIVKLLLDNGANPNCANERGETALHLAARGDQTEVMEFLLDNGAQVDAKAKELQTALHIAARQGNLAAVDLLLKRGASPNAATKDLYTPLHIAVREGHIDIAKRLLDHDANPGLTTKKGFTPLHLAAKHGQMKLVQLLLQRGVDPDIKGRNDLTPLHVATHYGNPGITTYLMNKGANPVSTTKNGYTPLHIAAKKDHTDIAKTLLERGAKPGCESRNGFTPLHLAAKEGHVQMVKLLFGRGADANCRSKNGLTPMHLAAQEDHVPVAEILVKNKAQIDPQTKAGYTPLHTACHFGQINMIQFLLEQGAAVNATTKQGFTPLHQAAQQGHVMVINLLLRYRANPNAVNAAGQTPLSIAQRLGYLSVVETLHQITEVIVAPSAMTGRYKPVSPETMQEVTLFEMEETKTPNMMTITEEEDGETEMRSQTWVKPGVLRSRRPGAAGVSQAARRSYQEGDEETFRNGTAIERGKLRTETPPPSHISPFFKDRWTWSGSDTLPPGAFRYLTPDDGQAASASPSYRDEADIFGFDKTPDRWGSMSFDYHALEDEMKYMSEPLPSAMDEITGQYAGTMSMAVAQQSKSRAPPPEQLELNTPQFARQPESKTLTLSRKRPAEDDVPDSREKPPDFLVSFLVDARGGLMEGSRPAGVRLIIPPGSVTKPTRITCRLIRVEKLSSPPLQMEGEALATRILEMGPSGTKFDRPILIDVPHFASLRGREREILVLRCDDGQTWQEHVAPPGVDEADILAVVKATFEDVESSDELYKKRISRILASDLPQYFALVTRITKETDNIDTHGGAILSANSPKVKVVVPNGAVSRSTKMGLQVHPIPEDVVTKRLSGRETALSPIVTVNPRRRKFNKPLTVMMPLPKKGFTRHAYANASTLRLLRNSNDGSVPAQWEDVTDSTPLTIMEDTATFSTQTSASFWLVDTPNIGESVRIASELHPEIILVPFMAKFVVCGRRHLPTEARLRIFCMTGDVLEKTIRNQGKFAELARSREVEVLNKTPQYLELDGNLAIVEKSGKQPSIFFRALKANGVPIVIRMCEEKQDPTGRLSFMRDPKHTKGRPLQIPICTMNVTLPHEVIADTPSDLADEDIENRRLGDPDQGYSDSSSVGSSVPMSDQELSPEEKAALHKKFEENASDLESEPDYSMGDQNGRIKKQEPSMPEIVLSTSPVKIDFIQEDNAYSSFAKPTNYASRILTKPELKEPAVRTFAVPVQGAKKEPVITHKTVDGGTRLVKDAKDKEYKNPDGSTVKERTSTTKHVKTVTEVTLTDGIPTDSQTKEELLLTEIEEHIVELPPGVTSLLNTNIQTETSEKQSESTLPDGSLVKKKTVRTVGRLKPTVTPREPKPEAKVTGPKVTHEVVEGELIPRSKTEESQRTRDDGVTEKLKIVTTQYFKPITEITLTDGLETGRKCREVLDNTNIEENILELPSGVIAPNADNCDTDISIQTSEFMMPDGTPAKKRTVRMIVHLKKVPEKQISVQRTEGDIRSTSEVLEDQENLDRGRKTRKRKMVTTKHFKPITEVTFVDGVASDPVMHEEFVGAEVDENILELSAGVIEPYGANCDTTISLENSELPLEEGVVAKKALVTMAVTPKPEKPGNGTSIVEGPITSKTETRQSEGKLNNGGTVRRKIVTTTFLNPIREVTTGDGPPKSRLIREEVVGMDVVENVLELPPGVTEPNGKNITTKTILTKSEETLPNGKVAKKKVIKTTAEVIDENVASNEQKPVPAKRKGKTTPTKSSEDLTSDDTTRRIVEGEIEPKVDVVEDEEKLEAGVIRKRKVVTTRYIKPSFEVTIANGMPPEFQKREEIVDAEIKENILELDYGVVAPNAANCDADILLTQSKTLLPEGFPAKKKTTKITVKLPEDGKQEAEAQAKAREARPKESRKLIEGDIERRSTVAEDKQGLSDGGTAKRKIITTKHIKPITEIISKEGKPSQENHWEELVATDIEENILQLPAGVIEPNSSNCDIEVSVDKMQVTLPDGNLANKTLTKMVVTLRDPTKPPKEKRRKRKPGSKGKPDVESEDRDIIEGPVESRTEVKEFEVKRTEGNLISRVVTTANVRSILKVSKVRGMEIKTKLREELVSKEIVENVLELPPGVTNINRRDVKTDTTVSSSVETLPEGVPIKKTLVRTVASLLGREELAHIPEDSGHIPDVIHKVIEGEIEPRIETEEDEQNLNDGTTVAQKIITTRYVKPITEVKLVKGHPPESTTKEEVVKADVSENILELPCGVIEPYGNNCETDISVADSETTLPENVPAKKKTTKMIVTLKTPSGEKIPRITKRLIEGEIESKSSLSEDKEDLNDGGTVWRKVTTTKHIKPVTEVTCTDGIPTQTKRWDELVGTDIEENILHLPAGVIEPNASNCDIDVSVDKSQVTLPDGSPANKTVIKTVVSLRDPKKPPRGKLRKRKWKPGTKISPKHKPELEEDVIEGPIESRSEAKDYEVKSSNGGLLKYHVVTTSYVKSILKISKFGGVEKKTKLREELDSKDIVENILELPPGVTDVNRRDIKIDTTVTSSSETLPEGVPVTKKVVKTTATLLGKYEIPEITGEADKIPDVVYKSIEGEIEPRIEYEEDEQTLDDGTTVRQNKTTTRYIKPITEVKLVKGSPPESTTKEVVVNAEVSENILELPCGVIEPNGDNCETKVSVTESEVTLSDNVPAKAKTTRMVVTLKPPTGEKVPKVTKKIIEGDVESKSSVTEDKEDWNDGGTIWRKVTTTKHVKPITEVTCIDGIPTQTKRWEELVGTDIEENILHLPAGVIEPKASNCDIDVSVDKSQVTLPDGSPANKTVIKTVVSLRDPKKPPRGNLRKRKWKPGTKISPKHKPELEEDVIEGPIESRSEVKDYELKSSNGGLLKYHVVTTSYVKSILKISKFGGVEKKTKLREELDSKDIVENILELPPGVTDVNRRDIKTDTTVTSSSETLPEGVPVTKKVVKTTATLLGKYEIPEITGEADKIPEVVYKSIEGEIEPRIEYEEDEQTLDDGTTVRQNKTTTRYIKPITEVKLVKGSPPESTTKEVVVNAEVSENILELPCGVIEPNGDNCETKVSVTESEVTLPDSVLAKTKTTRMVVTLKPPTGEKVPKVTKKIIEGDVESKSSVTEDKEDLNDGGTIWQKVTTTKHVKPITEVTCTDGIPTQTKRWDELVGTDIEENILHLPAGVIEPKASNCDIDVSVDKSQVTLPDGSPANKTVIRTVVSLRDPKKPPRGKLRKRKWKPGRKVAFKDKPEFEEDVIEGPIEPRSEVKDYEVKSSNGGLLKYHVVTTSYVKSILKISKFGGVEKKTKLREELDSKDIVENILELPPGVTDVNRRDIKTDATVTSSSDTLPEGVPLTKKVVKTTATLLGKNEIPEITGEADKIPDVVYKLIEGEIEPRIEYEEDEQSLDDGTTVRQNKMTTRYIKPITEVKLVKGSPPESTTKEVVVNAEVSENILELPCGVIEPNADNCETKVSVTESEVTLSDNVPAKAKTTRMVVTLKPSTGEKVPKVTKKIIEGDVESKSSVTEDKEDLNDGGTIWRKVTTTKHVKPITEITSTDGVPTQTKRWEELVSTDIEENVLQLPVGVIEPNSSNCDINVTADKFQVTLPDGSLANKTLIKTVVTLRDPFKPPREKGKKRKYKPTKKSAQKGDVRVEEDIIEGPVESRTEVKEYEVKEKDGGLVKYRVVTTLNVKTILKVSKVGGIERRTKLREELESKDIVENILELPPGVTGVNRRGVKTDTTVSSSEETLSEGVPVTKKVVRTTATLLRKGELPDISEERGEIPEVVYKVVEGDIEPRTEIEEDEQNLPDGTTIKQNVITTKYVKPTTEVKLMSGLPPESTTKEEVLKADVSENILELPCGVIEPYGENCETDVSTKDSKVTLPDNIPANKKTTRTTVALKPSGDGEGKIPKITRKLLEGDIISRIVIAEEKEDRDDGSTVLRKTVTVTHFKPFTDTVSRDGVPVSNTRWEELVGTDIEENVLQLPAGVIEPNSTNCDIDVSVDKFEVILPDGSLANKTLITTVVKLRDPSMPPRAKRPKRKRKSKGKVVLKGKDLPEVTDPDIIEGPLESRTEVKEYELKAKDGGLLKYRVVTTTYVRTILKLSNVGGVERKTKLREELDSKEIVENILELPPGVTDVNSRGVKTDTTVTSSEETLPEGVPVVKKVVKTVASLLTRQELAAIPEERGKVPAKVHHKVIEGEIEPRTEVEEDEQNLNDGTTVKQTVVTTRYVKPITEVKLVSGFPPESTTREEIQSADVSENILELPCGVIDPFASNCDRDITVNDSEVTLPEGTPAKKRTTRMVVQLRPSLAIPKESEHIVPVTFAKRTGEPKLTRIVLEGEVESRSEADEMQRNLDDGSTVTHRVVTTTYFKPITEIVSVDGIPTEEKHREEHVGTDIDENIVQLPAGVIEPNARNCDIDVSVDKSLVTLSDGILAKKTVTRMIVRLRDAKKPPRERLRKRKWKPGKKVATGKGKASRKPETEQGDIIEGPIESRIEVKEYEVNEKDGSLVKYRIVTTTNVKSILKLSKVGGIERRTKLREELDSKDIVENILELPPGVTDINRSDVKTDTTVTSSSETLPEGVPVKRKIVRTTASLLAEPDITAYEEPTEIPGVILKVIEGEIEPKREVEEDEKNLDDGRTVRQVVVTTKYVKPVTEVRLTNDGPPESTTREEIVDAEVSENILDLPCGVIEPNESNCNKDISVQKSEVTLPEGIPAKKKTTTVVIQLQPVGSVKADATPKRTEKPSEVTRKILEGEVQSKSVIAEDQEALDDGGTVKRKIITTSHIRPITEIILQDGLPLETKHREEIVGTDIEENVLKLPCGVIEPNAANCVADLSVDSFEVMLKDGTLAKKALVMMVVKLKDDLQDAGGHAVRDAKKLQALAGLDASKNIVEGPVQSRTESKQHRDTSDMGGYVHHNVVTVTYFKPVSEITIENGIEKKRLLRENVVRIEVVENILELPLGVTELDSRNTESETSVNVTDESLPNGVPVKKRVVKTVATLRKKPLAADFEQPSIIHRVIEGEVKSESEVVEFQDNLEDGTAIKRKVTTTRQVKPITEVKLTKGRPPESTTREETVASDVKEHVLELPCGTIEPNAKNCDLDISVDKVEDVTPENVPSRKKTTKMTVKLRPPVAETYPRVSRRIVEGEIEARPTVQEFKENLEDGATAKHKIITTKYIKPITEIISSDGLTIETKDREELVKTEIEENILQLPAGVIEPNASNCEADISVNTSDVALPDGSLARKTVTKVIVQLKDPSLLAEAAPELMAAKLLPIKPGEETRIVDGEITTETDIKEDDDKTNDGSIIKRKVVTMTHSRPTILITTADGKETRTTLQEQVVGVDIVENILKLPPGVTDPNEEGVKTNTSLKKFHETLPGGVPVHKEVIETIASLVRKPPEVEKEAGLWPQDISEVPDVTQRILEGPVEAKSEVKEDQKNLDDGRTIKQKEITTRYVKPVTEVILVDNCPPESTTKEELVNGDVKQIVLDLQCGRIEPFATNCETDISVENTSTLLPENLSVPKKVIKMTVHLIEPMLAGQDRLQGTGKQRISHQVVEGDIVPKSTTKEDEQTLIDGTVVRRKVITTQFFKAITEITLVDDVPAESRTRDELVDTIIDETVLQLSPGVIEPDASNCESDISFENSEVTLPDGTLAKKRLVRIVVQIKSEAESETTRTKVIEGPVELRPKLFKDEKKLGDGSTVRRKVTTTRHIKPIIEVVFVNGIETSSHLREEKLILTEIEENILQLPPGVKDVSGNNVQTKTAVKDFEDISPDGSPIKRKVIKTVATVGEPGTTEQVKGPPTPQVIEGPIQSRTTVKEDQRNLDEGVIRKEKVVTTVHFRPITEVILSEGSAPDSHVREIIIKTVIDECILELPAGVIMPFAENCNTEIKVDNFEYALPDGSPVTKKIVQMIVTLKKEFQPATGVTEAIRTGMKPKLGEGQTTKLVEGEVEPRTKVAEEQENLPNGVTLKRKFITTTFIRPVTEIVFVNGKERERHSREVTVGVDKEEHILELPCGVVEPYASNCDTDISVTNSQEQLPDGIVANKKVVKITVRLKPDYEKPEMPKAVGKRVAEGPVQPRVRVEERQETKDDGTRVKSKITTTENIKPVTETAVVNGVETESETKEQLVSTEIEADILELLPSVTEPYDDKTTDSSVTVKCSEEVSPDGLPVKKTVTTTVVSPKTLLSPTRLPAAKEVTHKTVKGEVRSQTSVTEDQKDLDDGSSIRKKILTTVYIMPITELTLVNGKETEVRTREEIVRAEIEEHLLHLPAGLIEPHADNCDIDVSVKTSDDSLPDGTPAKRKVVSTIVRLKVSKGRQPESHRTIEGEIRTVRDVKDDEKVKGDGRTIRTRTITTKWLKSVTDVALINGIEVKSKTREVVVATEIDENILELPPNVKDENRSDLQSQTSVEHDEVVLPDGTVAKRRTTRTVLTEPAKEMIPLVRHTLLEGPVESRKTETQDQTNTDDGKTIRRKIITTKHVKPVTDITLVDGTPTESSTKDVLLGVDIEEHILQLPPGVIEPFGSNCDTDISVENSEEALPEGVVAKKKVVTMIVSLKAQDKEVDVFSPVRPTRLSEDQRPLSPEDRMRLLSDREQSVERTFEKPVEVRKKVTEDQKNLEDGGTLRRKVITTDYVKPIWKVRVIDGKEKESFVRDEIVDTKIEEHILQLPPGVIEAFGSNCETDISVESTEVTLPDGRVAKKKIVKMIVFLKGSDLLEKVAEKRVSVTEEKPAPAEKELVGIPSISHRLEEGPIASLVKVTESQQILEDGSTVRRKVITTKFIRPVTDITLVDGVETTSETREENIRTEIEEITLKLPAGVIEPYGSNLETDTTVDQFDDTLPDGTPAKKKLVTIVVHLKHPVQPEKKESVSVSSATTRPSLSDAGSQVGSISDQEDLDAKRRAKASESAGVVNKVIEGAVSTTTEVEEDENCLGDGTTIRRKVVTTTHYKPVTKLVITDGLVSDATMAEETVKTEIDENILQLPPGVTDPKGDNLQTDTTVRTTQETLPDGSVVSRKVTKRVITMKPQLPPRRPQKDTEQDIFESQASTTFRKSTHLRTGADSPDSKTSRDMSVDSKTREMPSVDHRVVAPPQQAPTERVRVPETGAFFKPVTDDSDRQKKRSPSKKSPKEKEPPTKLLTVSRPIVTKRVRTKIRRVGPDGEIFEDVFTDEEDLSDVTSPTSAIADFHDLASPTLVSPADSDIDNPAIRVYTDTVETEPIIDRQVQEFEDTLPDGTLVKRRLIRTTQKKTIIKRVVMEGPEDEVASTSDEQMRQMLPHRPSSTEPQLTKYTDVTKQEPQTETDFKESEELLPDGTVAKKRVKTTTQQKLTTERTVLSGKLDDNALREIFKDDGAKALPAGEDDAKPDKSKASKRSQAEERSSRLMLRKQVHKRTVVEPGREHTVIMDETLLDRDDEEPEELRDSIRDVIRELVGSSSGSSGDESM